MKDSVRTLFVCSSFLTTLLSYDTASAAGTCERLAALNLPQVTITAAQTVQPGTFTTPDGQNCQCTATRAVTNVGPDGKGSPNYTIDPGKPVVTPVQPSAQQPKDKKPT